MKDPLDGRRRERWYRYIDDCARACGVDLVHDAATTTGEPPNV